MAPRPSAPQITAFAQVVREQSFSKAAERLGITQSAVTQHVANLERAVGTNLIHRSRHGLTLTRAGQEFFELADRQLTLDNLIAEKVAGYATLDRGHLSVIANAPRPALLHIARFRNAFPNVELTFTLFDWTEAMRRLRQRLVDVAIVTEPDRIGACYREVIGEARYVAYLPRDHPRASQEVVHLAELAEDTVLLPEEGSFTERIVAAKLQAHDLQFPRRIRTTTFPVMKEAILHGVGAGIFLTDSGYPTSGLVMRPIVEMPETYKTEIAVPEDKYGLTAVQGFLQSALETKDDPPPSGGS